GPLAAVEREQPRIERFEADAARGAEEPLRVESLDAVAERDRRTAPEAQRPVERLLEAAEIGRQPGDDEVDVVLAIAVEERHARERDALAVDARLAQPELPRDRELLLVVALPAPHDGREQGDALAAELAAHA